MEYFSQDSAEMHNDVEQLLRQERSSEVEIDTVGGRRELDREYQTCKINGYEISLNGCTCADFQHRKLPCKHMYRLARELKLFVNKGERSRELIADFSKGYADGWRFVVRPCNYNALDINPQTLLVEGAKRGKNSRKETVLTQGDTYNFKRGEIFYDTPRAYEGKWGDALKAIKVSVQVDEATESVSSPVVKFEDGRLVRRNEPIYGTVKFTAYKPLEDEIGMAAIKSYVCSADEFVELLKTGKFADENGEIIKLR